MHSFTHGRRTGEPASTASRSASPAAVPARCPLAFQIFRVSPNIDTSVPGFATWSGPRCASTSTGNAELAGPQLFVRGLRVCTGGTFPQVKGIEILSAKVNDGGMVNDATPTKKFTLAGCSQWQRPAICPQGRVAGGREDLLYRA